MMTQGGTMQPRINYLEITRKDTQSGNGHPCSSPRPLVADVELGGASFPPRPVLLSPSVCPSTSTSFTIVFFYTT
jgi:hypothetical protein